MNKKIILSILASSILVAQSIELEEINVVSATNTEQSLKDVTSNINVITKQDLEEKNFTTVTQALNTVSGINFSSNGGLGQATSVYLRGQSSKKVLVLIDGIRYNDITGLSGAPFENLMIEDIQQIEIVKGAQSGVWGADATAGVINIITSKPKDGVHASMIAEYGSYATKKIGASASYKTDEYYAKISSQKINSDGFSAQAPKGEDIDDYEDDAYENITTNIKAGFHIDKTNKIDVSHTIIDAQADFDGYLSPNSDDYSKTHDTFSQINFNHIDSFNEVDIYAKLSVFDRDYPKSAFSKNFDGKVKEYGAKSTIKYNEKDFILLGVDYKKSEHKNALQEKYHNTGVFITNSNELDLSGKTIITQSLRSDNYDKFDDKVTGKIGVKHFFKGIDGLSTSANIGSAYNVPTLYNLYDSWSGNANLEPESTLSYDFMISYKEIQVTCFYSQTKDMIDYDYSIFKFNNLEGKSKIKGVEVEYSTEFYDDIILSASYTYLDARNNKDEKLARRPKNTTKASIDYYAIKDFHFGIFGEYVGTRYDKADEKGEQTGKYAIVNLVADYDINQNFSLYAKIDNLFDKYYQVVDGYATAELSGYIGLKAKF